MKDKNGWEYAFGHDKYMRSIKDSNGNLQKAQYGPSTAGNYLAYLIDPTGARMDFGYGRAEPGQSECEWKKHLFFL